jgi:DNA phosphorothioation-dependent restriction protein DptG
VLRNLKAAITTAGYDSLGQFAKDINLSRTSISNKLNENVDFTAKEARKILVLLRSKSKDLDKISFDYIFLSDRPENGTE